MKASTINVRKFGVVLLVVCAISSSVGYGEEATAPGTQGAETGKEKEKGKEGNQPPKKEEEVAFKSTAAILAVEPLGQAEAGQARYRVTVDLKITEEKHKKRDLKNLGVTVHIPKMPGLIGFQQLVLLQNAEQRALVFDFNSPSLIWPIEKSPPLEDDILQNKLMFDVVATGPLENRLCKNNMLGAMQLDVSLTYDKQALSRTSFCLPLPARASRQLSDLEETSRSALYYQLALVQKALADEMFLNGSDKAKQDATEKYERAAESLSKAQSDKVDNSTKANYRLLSTEIVYRQALLGAGLDFWGTHISMTPGIPIRHLIALEDLLMEFDRLMTQIDSLSDASQANDREALKAKAALQELSGKLEAYAIERERAVIVEKRDWRKIGATWQRLLEINKSQKRVAAQLETIATTQKSLQSRATQMLTNAVARSAGVDLSMVEAIKSGDLKKTAEIYIRSELSNANSTLSKNLEAMSSDVRKFRELYETAKTKVDDLKALQSDLQFASEALNKPTLENLQKLGGAFLQRLPENKRKALTEKLERSLPTSEWIRSANEELSKAKKNVDAVAQIVSSEIAKSQTAVKELRKHVYGSVEQIVWVKEKRLQAQEVSEKVRQVVDSVSVKVKDVTAAKAFVQALAIGSSEAFVSACPSDVQSALLVASGAVSKQELIKKLESGFASSLSIRQKDAKLYFELKDGKLIPLDAGEIAKGFQLQAKTAEAAAGEMARVLDAFMISAPDQAVEGIFKMLPTEVRMTFFTRNASLLDQQKIKKEVMTVLQKEDVYEQGKDAAIERAVGAGIADSATRMAMEDTTDSVQPTEGLDDVPPEPEGGGPDPTTNALVSAALDMAFPGAGTALQLAQNFASMEANRERSERLAAEGAKLMAQKNELLDRQSDQMVDAILSQKDQQRAEALSDATRMQLSSFKGVLQSAVQDAESKRAKLALRRGWSFYLAERMREEFDLFDRSVALWSKGKAGRGVIEEEIRKNPQNARYALDSDIQLFDWLNRSRESSRSDPDFLRVHWARMLRLAKDHCLRQGCKPGDGMLGRVGQTRSIDMIRELLSPEDQKRFREWQKKQDGTFRAEFLLTPSLGIVPQNILNVRLIDVRMTQRTQPNSTDSPTRITLTHSGTSYIGRQDEKTRQVIYETESMLSRSVSSFNTSMEFDLEGIRKRYDSFFTGSNVPSPRVFEGYGMYAAFEILIEPSAINAATIELPLRIAYFYSDATSDVSEASLLRSVLKNARGQSISSLVNPFDNEVNLVSAMCDEKGKTSGESLKVAVRNEGDLRFFGMRKENNRVNMLDKNAKEQLEVLKACTSTVVQGVCLPTEQVLETARVIADRIVDLPDFQERARQYGMPKDKAAFKVAFKAKAMKDWEDAKCSQ